jgi:TrmH family RNA methyltransferase
MIEIVSPSNPKFKMAMKLSHRRGRQQQKKFLIDGLRETRYAIQSGIEVETLFIAHPRSSEQMEAVQELTDSISGTSFLLATELFERLSYGQRHSQVIGVAREPKRSLSQLQLSSPAFVVVVEGIEKPGNLGAIARTVDAVGADALILSSCVTDALNPNTIRASMGTVLSQKVVACETESLIPWLRENDIKICAAWVEGSESYHAVDFRESVAIVLGSEAQGLTPAWDSEDIQKISLPMHGTADSLNVSTTAAILLYEVWRQRQH